MSGFDSFVVLAAMRTGSNLLEERLNAWSDLECHGEVFNPAFVGHAGQAELFGLTTRMIADNPAEAVEVLKKNTRGIPGYRLFADHNPAALKRAIGDQRCAKIILTRNPVESFVSLKIVRKTNQWRLSDGRKRKVAKVDFDPEEFAQYLHVQRSHYSSIRDMIRARGQSFFQIDYSEVTDDALIAGLARWIGAKGEPAQAKTRAKRQNPEALSEKVTNFPQMVAELGKLDPLALFARAEQEPRRPPNLRRYVASRGAPILFLPLKSGPTAQVSDWLGRLSDPAGVASGLTQKELRQWKRHHKGHRSFTVVRHPVSRAFAAYLRHLIEDGDDHFPAIRNALETRYGVAMPPPGPVEKAEEALLRSGFLGFLKFLKLNLAGQTSVRVDPAWASQSALISGMAEFSLPDHVFREDELEADLPYLCQQTGTKLAGYLPDIRHEALLSLIHDDEIEAAARAAYQRDYMMFGFGPWKG